jgi:phosphohistidine phosphatase SixA
MHLAFLLLLAVPLTTALTADGPDEAKADPLVVFLVRHAEKVDSSRDPELSGAGTKRALELTNLLRDAGIDHVLSSDFKRTRSTATPLAEALGLEVGLYDPRDLPALVARLRADGGRHLVVGHSNTTPAAVELLGGEPGAEIDEADEYDRLYILTIATSGEVSTVVLRYGE